MCKLGAGGKAQWCPKAAGKQMQDLGTHFSFLGTGSEVIKKKILVSQNSVSYIVLGLLISLSTRKEKAGTIVRLQTQ